MNTNISGNEKDFGAHVESLRLDYYQENASPIIANVKVIKNDSFLDYLDARKDYPDDLGNLFGKKEFSVGAYLAEEIYKSKLSVHTSIYQANLVVTCPTLTDIVSYVTRLSSCVSLSLYSLPNSFSNPKFAINLYRSGSTESYRNIQRYWQMCWFARLRKILASIYLPNLVVTKDISQQELQEMLEATKEFSWDSVSMWQRYGFHYNSKGKYEVRNWCYGTKGDLIV